MWMGDFRLLFFSEYNSKSSSHHIPLTQIIIFKNLVQVIFNRKDGPSYILIFLGFLLIERPPFYHRLYDSFP